LNVLQHRRATTRRDSNVSVDPLGGPHLHGWLLDQSDDFKLEFGENAERAGELWPAALVLASRRDMAAYYDLLDRHAATDLADTMGSRRISGYLATPLHQTAPEPVPGDDAEILEVRRVQFDILCAAFRTGGTDWLGVLWNLTGETEAMGADALREGLELFNLFGNPRWFGVSARETIDWMIAKQAFAVSADTMPARPALLSSAFGWDEWVRVAETLSRGGVDTIAGPSRGIAIELLLGAGEVEAALKLAEGLSPVSDRLAFYRDVMVRLDRKCDAHSVYPGAGLVLGGEMMFRFE